MNIVTDPVLRGDSLWLALERVRTTLEEDNEILVTKDPAYEHGLNVRQINALAADAGLSDRPVFEIDNLVQGGVETDRFLKVNHPEIDEPIELTIWSKFAGPQISERKIARVLKYLDAWQQRRALQVKHVAAAPTIREGEKRFRVALSFSGDHRPFVEEVAQHLAAKLGRDHVLYDRFYEAEFARPNLDTYLQRLYHDESELIVVFLCAGYERKEWCGLEWRAIRDLIKQRRAESVMPLRFDMTEVPGLFSTDGYVWIDTRSAKDIAELILTRLGGGGTSSYAGDDAESENSRPTVLASNALQAPSRFTSIRESFEERLREGSFGGLCADRGAIAICVVPDRPAEIAPAALQNAPIPPPGLTDGWDREIDQDSVVSFRESAADQSLSSFIRYNAAEVFTDGTVLAADKRYLRRPGWPRMNDPRDYISSSDFEKVVVEWLRRAAPGLQQLRIDTPWSVGVSLVDINGFYLLVHYREFSRRAYGKDALSCKPVVFESASQLASAQSIAHVLRPCFDTAWRAFGYPCSVNYDAAGKWLV